MSTGPALVTLTLWGVPPRAVPAALSRMATDRVRLRRTPGLRFAKLLGTGDGHTFTVRDADPLHWGLLACWESEQAAAAASGGAVELGWQRLARERLRVSMVPLHSRGSWAGQTPFGGPGGSDPTRSGPMASITRARLRLTAARRFWRSVPPVSADLRQVPGLLLAVGIGEAPVGLQGTFSLWRDGDALNNFAHRRPAHTEVVRRTPAERWYSEELFARLRVVSVNGRFAGSAPLGVPDWSW